MIVYDDFVATVVFAFTVVVVVFVVAPTFCVFVVFTRLTPDNRLVLNELCVRSLRAAACKEKKQQKMKKINKNPCSPLIQLLCLFVVL